MAGASSDEITQRDLLGFGATVARALGWLVVNLHADKSNPRQVSGPDQLLLRVDRPARAHKYLLTPKMSTVQASVRNLYEGAGITYALYDASPVSIEKLFQDLA